jgi:hypothetical protein
MDSDLVDLTVEVLYDDAQCQEITRQNYLIDPFSLLDEVTG